MINRDDQRWTRGFPARFNASNQEEPQHTVSDRTRELARKIRRAPENRTRSPCGASGMRARRRETPLFIISEGDPVVQRQ